MRHKRSLIKKYVQKEKEMDDNITLADLHVICTDIMNDNYKEYFNVIKNRKVDDISVSRKKSSFNLTYSKCVQTSTCICYNGQNHPLLLAIED